MLLRLFQLVVVALPLGLFALALQPVQELMYGGSATMGILLFLAALALLAVVEVLLFRYWILPGWGDKVAEHLYAGSYLPQNDELALLVDRIAQTNKVEDIPLLQQLVRRYPRRLRGWLELVHLQQVLLKDDAAALETLKEAARAMRRQPEDAAMLLYRAALLCDKALHDQSSYLSLLQQAVTQYPKTVYGKKAAAKL